MVLSPVGSHPYPDEKPSGDKDYELNSPPHSQLLLWGYSHSERDAHGAPNRIPITAEDRSAKTA